MQKMMYISGIALLHYYFNLRQTYFTTFIPLFIVFVCSLLALFIIHTMICKNQNHHNINLNRHSQFNIILGNEHRMTIL